MILTYDHTFSSTTFVKDNNYISDPGANNTYFAPYCTHLLIKIVTESDSRSTDVYTDVAVLSSAAKINVIDVES